MKRKKTAEGETKKRGKSESGLQDADSIRKCEKMIYESKQKSNLLIEILKIAQNEEKKHDGKLLLAAATSLGRIFAHFASKRVLVLDPDDGSSQIVQDAETGEASRIYQEWMSSVFTKYRNLLIEWVMDSSDERRPQQLCGLGGLLDSVKFFGKEINTSSDNKVVSKSNKIWKWTKPTRDYYSEVILMLVASPSFSLDFFVTNYLSVFSDAPFYTANALISLMEKDIKEINTFVNSKLTSSDDKERVDNSTIARNLLELLLHLKLPASGSSSTQFLLTPPKGLNTEKLKPNILTNCWLAYLKQPFPFPVDVYKRILFSMDQDIFPSLSSPIIFSDFLTDSFNLGGIVGILSLSSLFVLITQYNLEYPKYYTKLYSLLSLSVFQAKYRQKFLTLLNQSLYSSHVPGYLVAAFLKRLARISLYAPPFACSLICALIFNILQRHPSCQVLLHRPTSTAGTEDPFKEEEEDPTKCNAINSSLWEIKTLCNHYCAPVSRLAKLVFEEEVVGKAPRPPHVLEDFLALNYTQMMDTELKWRKNELMPLAFHKQESFFDAGDVFHHVFTYHGQPLGGSKKRKETSVS